MISEIVFGKIAKSKMFGYAAEVEYFKANKKIVFQPGLNVLFGPNGCGKSTIINMIAMALAAAQGGMSIITEAWLRDVIDSRFDKDFNTKQSSVFGPVKVKHDGQPILYGNPRNAVGVRSGHLDDDFAAMGMLNSMSRDSTGQATLRRMRGMLAALKKDVAFPSEIDARVSRSSVNSVWKEKLDLAEAILAPSIPKGQPTEIYDEPESGLALPVQGNLFDLLHQAAVYNDFQIIVASHSPACLGLANVHYIDMEPGYLAHTQDFMRHVARRIEAPSLPEPLPPKKPAPRAKKDEPKQPTGPASRTRTARSFTRK